jgi:mannose-6-phosphate isomerase-like protein (cupin superfamily)
MKLIPVILLMALAIPALAQSSGKAEVFSLQGQLASLVQKAAASGSSGATLGDYTTHKIMLSARTTSGGAEVHAHYDDVMLVTEGKATLITGGSVIDPHTGDDGETRGSGIKDGTSQPVSVGDIIHVPAGTPHQLIIPTGASYSAIVIKVREQ